MADSVDLDAPALKLFRSVQAYALSQGYKIYKADWSSLIAADVIAFDRGVFEYGNNGDWKHSMIDFLSTLGADRFINASRRQNNLDYPS
jgi:hypothetical protein